MGVLVPDLCKGHYIVCCPDKLHEPQRRCRCLTKLITLEIRFWPSSSLAILVQDMVVMGKVYPKMCTYIYIYIFRIILHFIIFLLSDPSSSSRKHPHHPFCPSVLASWESTHHVRCESRCEVVVTCQMIVTSHGGSPMSCIELKGGEITERNTCSTGSWQIYCWTMVFMYSSYMILI